MHILHHTILIGTAVLLLVNTTEIVRQSSLLSETRCSA
jgi:hypothetical protein